MRKFREIVTYLLVIALGGVLLYSPSLATAAPSRADCQEINNAGFSLDGPFQDIGPMYIRRVLDENREDRPGSGGTVDEIREGAIVLVITNQNQVGKLLASVEGTDLLIRKFETYGSGGNRIAVGENLRLPEGGGLDLDAGTVDPTPPEADVDWKGDGTTQILQPLNGTRLKVLVVVPVIAHYMNRRGSELPELQSVLSNAKLQELFAPGGKVNQVWRQAGVFFFLSRVEKCTFSVLDFLPEESREPGEGIPVPSGDCRSLFSRMNRVYNWPVNQAPNLPEERENVYGADVYLWWKFAEKQRSGEWNDWDQFFGYGAQHRDDGPNRGLGAIWINALRCSLDQDCGRQLAHEVGHFLGLCHICETTAVTPPEQRGWCGFCRDVPDCSPEQGNLLMRDDAGISTTGEQLSACEISRVRRKALDHRARIGGGHPQ